MIVSTAGNFQDGEIAGKVQAGSGWWFNDQLDGMERQMTQLSQMGLFLPLYRHVDRQPLVPFFPTPRIFPSSGLPDDWSLGRNWVRAK